jgi:hypothetical protein
MPKSSKLPLSLRCPLPTKTRYASLLFPIRATCPANLLNPDLITWFDYKKLQFLPVDFCRCKIWSFALMKESRLKVAEPIDRYKIPFFIYGLVLIFYTFSSYILMQLTFAFHLPEDGTMVGRNMQEPQCI